LILNHKSVFIKTKYAANELNGREMLKLKAQIEVAKEQGIVVELRNIGYSEKEIAQFQKKVACPRCGCNFVNLPYSGRWLAHLSNCDGPKKQTV
jgi:hypothetical protein